MIHRPKTEQERKWFSEVVQELRKVGVRGKIEYAGCENGHANAISPQTQGGLLFLVCGEVSEPGEKAQGVLSGTGYRQITPVEGGFKLLRHRTDTEILADEYNIRKGYTWCINPLEQFVDRQGNPITPKN